MFSPICGRNQFKMNKTNLNLSKNNTIIPQHYSLFATTFEDFFDSNVKQTAFSPNFTLKDRVSFKQSTNKCKYFIM